MAVPVDCRVGGYGHEDGLLLGCVAFVVICEFASSKVCAGRVHAELRAPLFIEGIIGTVTFTGIVMM